MKVARPHMRSSDVIGLNQSSKLKMPREAVLHTFVVMKTVY